MTEARRRLGTTTCRSSAGSCSAAVAELRSANLVTLFRGRASDGPRCGRQWLVLFVFDGALIIVTFIDLGHRIFPDVISLPGMVVGFLLSIRDVPGPISSAAGILFGASLLRRSPGRTIGAA